MNRRNFLKRCSILPFVGSLFAVGDSGASESKSGCSWKGKLKCGGQNGPLCPRCIYGVKRSGTKLATKKDFQNYKRYYVHYDFETKVQTVIEDEEIVSAQKFKEDPYVMFNPDPTISYVIFEKYKQV